MIRSSLLSVAAGSLAIWLSTPSAAHAEDRGEDSESSDESDEEIVVTGSRTETTRKESVVATQVIRRAEIETSGASTVADLLESQPGVSLQRTFAGTSIQLQGMNPEHTLILVDGQRIAGRKNGAIDMSRYPVDWIERIEIVKGPSSALYGSEAMGGVINIITRKADKPFSVDAWGSYGTPADIDGSASLAVQKDGASARLHGGHHTTEGYDRDPSTLSTNGPARKASMGGGIAELAITPDWVLRPRISYRLQDSSSVSENDAGAVFDQRNLSEEVQAAVGSDLQIGPRDRLQITAFSTWYRDQYNSDQRRSDALDSYQDTRELLAQGSAQYDRLFGKRHHTTVGLEGLAEQMKSDRLDGGEGTRRRASLFVQDEWTILDERRLVLLPGARADIDSQFGPHSTPRLALRYSPGDTWIIRAGAGWGYRAPSFKELLLRFENPSAGYIVTGNEDLKPESSRNANLDIEWSPTDSIVASLSGYHNRVDDLIDFGSAGDRVAGSPMQFAYINVAEAITRGGELNLTALHTTGLSIAAGYTLNDTLDIERGRPLEGRSLHRVTGQVRQTIASTGTLMTAKGSWESPRPYFFENEDGTEARVDSDDALLIDARIFQDIALKPSTLRLYVGADNLLDTGDATLLPLPPRTFFIGLTGRTASNLKDSQ